MPRLKDLTITTRLTKISVKYIQDNNAYIADLLFPPIRKRKDAETLLREAVERWVKKK